MVLNPEHGFISDRPLKQDDLFYLVKVCVDKLCETDSPSLETIRLQVYFDSHCKAKGDLVVERHNEIKIRTAPLRKEIMDSTVKSRDDLEKLYRKIVVVSIMTSGLGNPTSASVMKETVAAMQSVFAPSELGQFVTLSTKEKEQQIQELTQIVTGIRLFNRDCQKGGEEIEDLPGLLQRALTATSETLQMYLTELMCRINTITTAVDNTVKKKIEIKGEGEKKKFVMLAENKTKTQEEEEEMGEEKKSEKEEEIIKVTNADIDYIKSCLALARQQEVFLRRLLADVDGSNTVVKEHLECLQKRLLQIHDTVRFRTAIPTVQVYPQFIDLSEIWTGLQDEMVFLSRINTIATDIQCSIQVLDTIEKNMLKFLIGTSPVLSDEDRLESTTGLTIKIEGKKCEVIHSSAISDFDQIPLQFLGFCPWTLVEGDGALIPGNPNMGVCHWDGKYYAFSSPEAAAYFGNEPEKYVTLVLNMARIKPELIGLLQLQEQIEAQKDVGEIADAVEETVTHDVEMQTELHPIPSHIDPNYSWNEWELKRRAIQLANISKCVTHSTQTYKSHKRLSLAVQTNPAKDAVCQTKRDGYSNVPKLKNFIFGLRGRKDDKQHVISLTPPIKEKTSLCD
ncbi:cilia- and flagella-associated protein 206 [Anabrus simplex]|uniref:cilia- and flagella-associated protein 206 n=1 Tax=Anabrus simplex TaxID=316456 RepID=UPI0035A2D710